MQHATSKWNKNHFCLKLNLPMCPFRALKSPGTRTPCRGLWPPIYYWNSHLVQSAGNGSNPGYRALSEVELVVLRGTKSPNYRAPHGGLWPPLFFWKSHLVQSAWNGSNPGYWALTFTTFNTYKMEQK